MMAEDLFAVLTRFLVSRAEFEREISDLKQRVNDLQERIARLEADL